MGRAFEYRKERKFKRWGQMAKAFTRIGKEIVIAIKSGGTDPTTNPKLRAAMQNARAANMPKDTVERAIKRATQKDQEDYKEVIYEGFAPHGVAVLVETLTDNIVRTVANVRAIFNKYGGNLSTSGSVEFMFDRKSVFRIKKKEGMDMEAFEFELIDCGMEEIGEDEGELVIYGTFESFGDLQKYFEANQYEVISSQFDRIPNVAKPVSPTQEQEALRLIEKLEEDDDVQNVFNNMQSVD